MSSENEPMSPEMKDEVDTQLLARCISSLTLNLSPPGEPPKWGHLSEESAMTLARYIKSLDTIMSDFTVEPTKVALYGALMLAEDLALELVGRCNDKAFHQAQVDSIRADLKSLERATDKSEGD